MSCKTIFSSWKPVIETQSSALGSENFPLSFNQSWWHQAALLLAFAAAGMTELCTAAGMKGHAVRQA